MKALGRGTVLSLPHGGLDKETCLVIRGGPAISTSHVTLLMPLVRLPSPHTPHTTPERRHVDLVNCKTGGVPPSLSGSAGRCKANTKINCGPGTTKLPVVLMSLYHLPRRATQPCVRTTHTSTILPGVPLLFTPPLVEIKWTRTFGNGTEVQS